jgi:hypothetical protein
MEKMNSKLGLNLFIGLRIKGFIILSISYGFIVGLVEGILST